MIFLRVGCLAGHVFTRVYTWRLKVREWELRPATEPELRGEQGDIVMAANGWKSRLQDFAR
jgi:hypothetical protein